MKKFIVGREYTARSACDYNCIFRFVVTRRTEKSVWISEHGETPQRRVIDVYGDEETIRPYGNYSMAPILGAGRGTK